MKVSDTPSALKQIRKTGWKFQRTFVTPVKKLRPFVATIVSAGQSFQTASITIDQAVFEPKHWIDQLIRHSLPPQYQKGTSVTAVGEPEIEELLHAVFSDCVDFLFVPVPKTFVIYADHDEYTTFYANARSSLNRVTEPLLTQGFHEVSGYQRRL
jgi:hypothetical protein